MIKLFRRKRKKCHIPINSIVAFDDKTVSTETYERHYKEFFHDKTFVFGGEVPNAPGHCVLFDLRTSSVIGMYHTNNFRLATDDEI